MEICQNCNQTWHPNEKECKIDVKIKNPNKCPKCFAATEKSFGCSNIICPYITKNKFLSLFFNYYFT